MTKPARMKAGQGCRSKFQNMTHDINHLCFARVTARKPPPGRFLFLKKGPRTLSNVRMRVTVSKIKSFRFFLRDPWERTFSTYSPSGFFKICFGRDSDFCRTMESSKTICYVGWEKWKNRKNYWDIITTRLY